MKYHSGSIGRTLRYQLLFLLLPRDPLPDNPDRSPVVTQGWHSLHPHLPLLLRDHHQLRPLAQQDDSPGPQPAETRLLDRHHVRRSLPPLQPPLLRDQFHVLLLARDGLELPRPALLAPLHVELQLGGGEGGVDGAERQREPCPVLLSDIQLPELALQPAPGDGWRDGGGAPLGYPPELPV